MTESTEQLHERVEEMKSEMWGIAQSLSGPASLQALEACLAIGKLADRLHKHIAYTEALERVRAMLKEDQPND